jgi:hypothetical protein
MSDRKMLRENVLPRPAVDESADEYVELYSQYFPRIISMEGWLAKAQPDAPALPWRGDQGEEICGFAVMPLSEARGMVIVLIDSHGREVVRSGNGRAILATCLAFNSTPWEVTFLPVAKR